jgi:hypothetical protein
VSDLDLIKYKIAQLEHKEILGREPLPENTQSVFGDLEKLLEEDAVLQNTNHWRHSAASGSRLLRYTVTPLPTLEQRTAAKAFNAVVTKRNKYVFGWNSHRRFNRNPRSKRGNRLRGAIEIYDQLLKELVDLGGLPMPRVGSPYIPQAQEWEE